MKVKENKQPVSAFAVYSEKLKQKKKQKPLKNAGVAKAGKEKEKGLNAKQLKQMEEIGMILRQFSKQSNSPNSPSLLQSIEKANVKLKRKPKESMKKVESIGFSQKMLNNFVVEPKEKKNGIPKNKIKRKILKPKPIVASGDDNESDSTSSQIPLLVPIQYSNSINGSLKTKVEIKPTNGYGDETQEEVSKIKKLRSRTQIQKETLVEAIPEPSSSVNSSSSDNEVSFDLKENVSCKQSNIPKIIIKETIKKSKKERDLPHNSSRIAINLFEWLVAPVKEQDFMRDYWEKQPLLIQRPEHRNYFVELLSSLTIDKILRENNIFFTKHLDVTSYTDGVRETHNPLGRAQANVVWDFYSNGCSVRMLNPQAFVPKIHALNSTLQEYFGCFVGANVYLTPPNSQGFAPHYDDIEAFVLQIEGKKHWKVYKPRNNKEVLPRLSSRNFGQEEIGEPLFDVVLEPGDMLYFPRGFVHQATTVDNEHSLHITLSAYQKTAWVDLLEKTLPIALKRAAEEDVEFRRGLPRDYLGIENRRNHAEKRGFLQTALGLVKRLEHYVSLSLGAGVDQMGAQFMHDALPPVFTPEERSQSVLEGGLKMETNGRLRERAEITPKTEIRFIRPNICRLVEEEDEVRLYHCLDNPMEYHAEEPQFLILPPEGVLVVTLLSQKYPAYVSVESIPHPDPEALLALLSDLWDSGLLVISGL